MLIASGQYSGNSTDNRTITGLGFAPDAVLLRSEAARDTVFKTGDMGSGNSVRMRSDVALETGHIKTLDADGFTLGTSGDANTTGEDYNWVAFKDNGLGDFKVFTYTGNGVDNRSITGFGFAPACVLIKGNTANTGALWFEDNTAGNSSTFYSAGEETDRIQDGEADGIQLGTHIIVNGNTVVYYGIAFKETSTAIAFTYVGDGVDNRSITTPGFLPEFVIVKRLTTEKPVFKTANMDAGYSSDWESEIQELNQIQALEATGFQVGTGSWVNVNTATHLAFAAKSSVAVSGAKTLSALGVG